MEIRYVKMKVDNGLLLKSDRFGMEIHPTWVVILLIIKLKSDRFGMEITLLVHLIFLLSYF